MTPSCRKSESWQRKKKCLNLKDEKILEMSWLSPSQIPDFPSFVILIFLGTYLKWSCWNTWKEGKAGRLLFINMMLMLKFYCFFGSKLQVSIEDKNCLDQVFFPPFSLPHQPKRGLQALVRRTMHIRSGTGGLGLYWIIIHFGSHNTKKMSRV